MALDPDPANSVEAKRLAALRALALLDTPAEERFDRLTRLASRVFGAPVALISLIDDTRQWCKSKVGFVLNAIPRDLSICAETIARRQMLVVPDLLVDPCYGDNPLVAGELRLRFYAGAPLYCAGLAVGTLCVLNSKPRAFSADDGVLLQDLARLAEQELTRGAIESQRSSETVQIELQRVLDDIDLAVITVNENGRIESLNRVGLGMFDYAQAEVFGEEMRSLLPLPSVFDKVQTGDIRESVGRRRGGGLFSLEFSMGRSEVGATGLYLYFVRDISAHKREAEALRLAHDEALQALQAKARFLATMSHEIRTPMNGVIGMTGLLLDSPLSEEQRDWTQTIRASGEQLLAVINDILDYSEIESSKLELEIQPFDLVQCLEDAASLVASQAVAKSLDLFYEIDASVPPFLSGDVMRLRQILVNLLGNAVKFTQHGEVVVSVRVPDGASAIEFTVRDTGIGITADSIAKLFQPFMQADSSTSRRYGGSGLGLVICRHLVSVMGGDIQVDSVVGAGSTFRFTIDAPAAPSPLPVPAYLEANPPTLIGKRVLLVDDSTTYLAMLRAQLARWGVYAESTPPAQTLACLERGELFDLVIIDLQMPRVAGSELIDEVFALAPTLPLVGLSSSYIPRERRGNLAAFLMKPLRQARLFDVLMRIVAGTGVVQQEPYSSGLPAVPPPLTILVAEDNAVNQKLVIEMLRRLGYRADLAANGIEAVEAVARRSYDLILMDMQMPEMDGLTATRKIVAHFMTSTTLSRPYIVAVTANASQADRDSCLEAGMDHYITKPMKFEVLRAVIEAVIKHVPVPETAPPSAPDAAVLDAARVAELVITFNGSIKRLSEVFVRSGAENLERLRACAEVGDTAGLTACAHSLKGMSLNIGATKFAALCATVEQRARQQNLHGMVELPAAAGPLFNRTCDELLRVDRSA